MKELVESNSIVVTCNQSLLLSFNTALARINYYLGLQEEAEAILRRTKETCIDKILAKEQTRRKKGDELKISVIESDVLTCFTDFFETEI